MHARKYRATNYSFELGKDNYKDHIAPARTFILKRTMHSLVKSGYTLGMNKSNTIILEDSTKINQQLRFKDEYIRHTILEYMGNFALSPAPLLCRVSALKRKNTVNNTFLQIFLHNKNAFDMVYMP